MESGERNHKEDREMARDGFDRERATRLYRENHKTMLDGSHDERLTRLQDVLPEVENGKVREVLTIIEGCVPRGDHQDGMGGSWKQLTYIFNLARFSDSDALDFQDVLHEIGGISMAQCGEIIRVLKETKKLRKAILKKELKDTVRTEREIEGLNKLLAQSG